MNIVVACFPKSGSSYFTNLLSHVTGFEIRWLMYHTADDSPQGLYERWIEAVLPLNTITQQHLIANEGNVMLIKKYGLRVIVHVRNLFDALISLHDHIELHKKKVLTGHIGKAYFEMTREEQLRFLANLHIPFYLELYASWLEAQHEIPVLWTTYEEMITDQVRLAKRALQFYSLSFSEDEVRSAFPKIDMSKARFNKGIAGRGSALPEEQKNEIRRLANLHKFPADALKLIGL